ncbi:metallophosphoesterase [Cloacibacillus sp. An23]|uniref:metallophosphoesterase n=1 Tax=Cloacibacillus sp. An23 TaxID=1965591 RepID=UPI000B3AB271|nr:metallophosphoesterase [Cloacibacillus sp. An23]OUO93689.1 hypothetical protein B5F39_05765 [Cloacibacillus sp. An23]
MFRTVAILLVLYPLARFVLPLRASWPVKAALSAFIVAAAFKQQFFTRFGGHFFSPELPKPLIEGYTVVFAALAALVLLTLCRDLWLTARCAARAVSALRSDSGNFYGIFDGSGLSPRAAAAMLTLSVAVGVYGVYEAQRQPRVVEREAALAGLPPEFDGCRIVLLSDMHISASRRAPWTEELVRRVDALSPDLILITGDFIDGAVNARRADVEPLAGLRAKEGVFGVFGNHEYYFGWREWGAKFEEFRIRMLANESAVIERGGGALVVAGLADEYAPRGGAEGPDVRKALAGAPEGAPVILMDHRPGRALENALAGADLQLSGHTHGGMVWGLAEVIAKYNGGYVNGWYDAGGMKLFVSPGTGIWNGFLVRIGVPAELTVLTLRRAGE